MKLLTYIFLLLFFHSLSIGQAVPFDFSAEKGQRLEVVLSTVGTGYHRNVELSKINTSFSTDKVGFKLLLETNRFAIAALTAKSSISQIQQIKAQSFSFYTSGLSPPAA
jgi:hypothetical protein